MAQLRCVERSRGHVHMVQLASDNTPVETVAVCDLRSKALDRRAAQDAEIFGNPEKSVRSAVADGRPSILAV